MAHNKRRKKRRARQRRRKTRVYVRNVFEEIAPFLFRAMAHMRQFLFTGPEANRPHLTPCPRKIGIRHNDDLIHQYSTWQTFLSSHSTFDNASFSVSYIFAWILHHHLHTSGVDLALYFPAINRTRMIREIDTEVRIIWVAGASGTHVNKDRAFTRLHLMSGEIMYVDITAFADDYFGTTQPNGDGYPFDVFTEESRPEYFQDNAPDTCSPEMRHVSLNSILLRELDAIGKGETIPCPHPSFTARSHTMLAIFTVRFLICVRFFIDNVVMAPQLKSPKTTNKSETWDIWRLLYCLVTNELPVTSDIEKMAEITTYNVDMLDRMFSTVFGFWLATYVTKS